jgi:hypothetical protein
VIRAGVLTVARLVLLAGPTALAFFTGGYFPEAQVWAGLAVWLLVAVAAALGGGALPRGREVWLALGGLVLFGAWTLLSITWAPIAGNAYHAGQVVMLYAGGLLAATLLLRTPATQRFVEPALAAGTVIVIGYGLAGRLLPGLLSFARSFSALGRLEQPLTYWNAMGELAALGFVLCAAIAGNRSRPSWLRAAAAAATVPLGTGLYLSFSRGALFACAAGLVALLVAAPRREQLEAILLSLAGGVLGSAAAVPFKGVTSLAGTLATRERQGIIVLVLLVLLAALAGAVQRYRAPRAPATALRLPRRAGWIAVAVICAGLVLAIVVGSKENASRPLSGGASRFVTLQSNRYAYWRVAIRAFAHEPLHGVGAGGWAVWWLRNRPFDDAAQDAHSLELQTLAELGVVGVGLLLVFFVGVATSAAQALRRTPAAAGPIAALVVYLAHSPLDWDWQMPAVTTVAMILAGSVLAIAGARPAAAAERPAAEGGATAALRSGAPRG